MGEIKAIQCSTNKRLDKELIGGIDGLDRHFDYL